MGGGDRFRVERFRAEPPLLQDLGEHGRSSLVKHRASANAENGLVHLPSGGKLGAVDHGRGLCVIFSVLGGVERGEAAQGLVGFVHLRSELGEPAARLEIGKIVEHLFDRIGDALRLLGIEQAAARVPLGKLETCQRHVLEIGSRGSDP